MDDIATLEEQNSSLRSDIDTMKDHLMKKEQRLKELKIATPLVSIYL